MNDAMRLAAAQLGRMRGMTVEYHRQFFRDIRFAIVVISALFVAGYWQVPEAILLIPFVALYTAVQTAFDASYLIFARQYAAKLEEYLNDRVGGRIHVGAAMEDAYLFPLDDTKIVTAAWGSGFSWFGFVTLFYTAVGIGAAAFALVIGYRGVLQDVEVGYQIAYVGGFAVLAVAALAVGWWWFVTGAGERRLREVLSDYPQGA